MRKVDPEFVGQRAEQLARMYLTRRKDIEIVNAPEDLGYDLLVSLLQNGENVGRHLAVQVKAAISGKSLKKREDAVQSESVIATMSHVRDLPFPVCLFFFTMDDDSAYWKWIREPLFEEPGRSKLSLNLSSTLRHLTDDELDRIMTDARKWYELRGHSVAA